ncbi:MAG: DUF6544 family protein [bacterium]
MKIKKILMGLLGLIIIIAAVLFYRSQAIVNEYRSEVLSGLERTEKLEDDILTENDIKHLPENVQKYLKYVGVLGKEKVNNFKVVFDGRMKFNPSDKEWMENMKIEQYSFFDETSRFFLLKKFPVIGVHSYKSFDNQVKSIMKIRLAGYDLRDAKGKEMNQAETVTILNDMCLMAPATLIDPRIKWEDIDPLTTKAIFTNDNITISAILSFNEKGQLVDFVSDDRYYYIDDNKYEKVRWSTPVKDYEEINGLRLPVGAVDVKYHLPEGDFIYADYDLIEIEYNVESME